ncbi:hypothetical protein DASC09_000190 [Saccharomycopsis crataegensis]|uniref:Uncharacterized protein n=1 Tax=Saccharomycopsis crataegensis TaxID=43959 RepID=A0AAV5QD98_9ASCO|nr:hypothetical protein DASC09_000190 [Saccharomycopsis crataegensis]
MSGGFYPYPKHVWTPTGGWWFTPKNAKTNAVVITTAFVATLLISYKAAKPMEFDPQLEHSEETIAKWNNAVKK